MLKLGSIFEGAEVRYKDIKKEHIFREGGVCQRCGKIQLNSLV
jgi:hypothetical protein